ncbi:hypothetical protein [Paenibacillus sp. YN15]|uniref:hypothetical protein n=1 Tax=Paenibacillus sp. YN15 TaxID=1742774 RepID=UPI000DCB2867|nr:hypothetical protein [Paenibacillus sp. YN15]RAV02688.1 hypothetical protein DQG13_09300 [Paenibacillus sp. YN15]
MEFIKTTFHNLSIILKTIEPYLNKELDPSYKALIWMEKLFADMSEIDQESDSFRYPFGIIGYKTDPFSDKKFKIKSVFEKQTHLDLVAFANKMEISFNILSCFYSESPLTSHSYNEYKPILFEGGGSYYSQSVVGYSYNKNKFYPYVRAYTESATYIYEYMMLDKGLKDDMFLPMCYLYRNGIELAMKEILFEECSLDHQKALSLLKDRKHGFLRLWNTIVGDIEKHANADTDDPTLENVQKYINQLHEIDGTSDKFRYPTDKFLKLHFKKEERFDIQIVAFFFCELGSFLDGVCMQMAYQNDIQAEYESEMRSYYK